MKKIILITFLLANLSIALGQRTSVKTQPTGSGPVLSGVSIVHTKIGVDPTKVRFEKRMPTYNVVFLKFSLNGNVSSYRYKGKTYQTYYPISGNLNDCPGAILNNAKGPSMGLSVKATIVIRVNRQTYTQTTTTIATAGVYHFRFTLDEYVQEQFVDAKNIVSITVEPVPISYFENQLDRMEQCKERKEKEKKAKEIAEKEAKGQKTTQKDDDFWAGGEETKLTLVATDTKATAKNTNDDFWSGNNTTQQKSNNIVKDDFWAGKGTKEEEIALEKKIAQDSDNQYLGEKEITTQRIKITYRDHGAIDGDRVSVYHNSLNIANNITLRADEQAVNVTLSEGINRITFEALNEGTEGNNTAEFKIYDDKENQIYTNKWSISTGYRGTLIIIKK